jgi:hypothetical protein
MTHRHYVSLECNDYLSGSALLTNAYHILLTKAEENASDCEDECYGVCVCVCARARSILL